LQKEINRFTFDLAIDSAPNSISATDDSNVPKAGVDKSSRSKKAFGTVNPSGRSTDLREAFGTVQSELSNIESQISLPQSELDRLTRQFWVTKEQVKTNKYDLSASRYRQVEADAAYHEQPSVTLERLARLESVMLDEINSINELLK